MGHDDDVKKRRNGELLSSVDRTWRRSVAGIDHVKCIWHSVGCVELPVA